MKIKTTVRGGILPAGSSPRGCPGGGGGYPIRQIRQIYLVP